MFHSKDESVNLLFKSKSRFGNKLKAYENAIVLARTEMNLKKEEICRLENIRKNLVKRLQDSRTQQKRMEKEMEILLSQKDCHSCQCEQTIGSLKTRLANTQESRKHIAHQEKTILWLMFCVLVFICICL